LTCLRFRARAEFGINLAFSCADEALPSKLLFGGGGELELRDRGVYRLAGWQDVVAAKGRDGMFYLFTPEHWRASGPLDYRVTPGGRLVYRGAVTSWRVEQLADTGRTAARVARRH
jgi:hypothetical protein